MNENFKSGMKGVGKVLLIIYLTLATIAGVVFGYLYISQKNASAGGGGELSITDAGKLVKTVANDLGVTAKYSSSTTSSNKLKSEPLSLEYKPYEEDSVPFMRYGETGQVSYYIWLSSKFFDCEGVEYNTYYKDYYRVQGHQVDVYVYAVPMKDSVEFHVYDTVFETEFIIQYSNAGSESNAWECEIFSDAPFIQYHGNGKGVGYIKAAGKNGKTTDFYYCTTMTHYWNEEPFQDMENLTIANVKEFTLMDYSVTNQNYLDTSSITDEEKIQKTKDAAKIVGTQNFIVWNSVYNFKTIDFMPKE